MKPIDGDAIKRRAWDVSVEWRKQGKDYEAMLLNGVVGQIVDTAPTLTPPNEPLTCEGCYWQTHGSFGKCIDCIRGKDADNYRRPPEREEASI